MVYDFSSEQMVRLAYLAGLILIIVALALFANILRLRISFLVRERKREQLTAKWRRLLLESLAHMPEQLPRVRAGEYTTVLSLWNYLHESLQGSYKERLNRIAWLSNIERIANEMLTQGKRSEMLLAIVTLGNLRCTSAWDRLMQIASNENGKLSLTAMKALVQIDAEKAIKNLLPVMQTLLPNSAMAIYTILRLADSNVISRPLADALAAATPEKLPHLIRLLTLTESTITLPVILRIAASSSCADTILACLYIFAHFQCRESLPYIRRHTKHADWRIRVRCASALARVSTREDEELLVAMLSDESWWVRYRAAQTLAQLNLHNPGKLIALSKTTEETAAREILTHVIKESVAAPLASNEPPPPLPVEATREAISEPTLQL